MMQLLTKLLIRLKLNGLYAILGLYSILKGAALMTKKYPQFYFPPELRGLMNSPVLQWALIVAGVLMIGYILSSYNNEHITGVLISFIAGLITILCLLEFEHWYFLDDYGPVLASDLTVLAITSWTARHRCKR